MLVVETNAMTAATAIVGLIVWIVFPVSEWCRLGYYRIPSIPPLSECKSFHGTVSKMASMYSLALMGLKSLRDWKVVSRVQYPGLTSFTDLYSRYSNTLLVIFNNRLLLHKTHGSDRLASDRWQGTSSHKTSNFSAPRTTEGFPVEHTIDIVRQTGVEYDNSMSLGRIVSSRYYHLLGTNDWRNGCFSEWWSA